MAYGVKYRIEWTDESGNDCKVDILVNGYASTIYEITPAKTAFKIDRNPGSIGVTNGRIIETNYTISGYTSANFSVDDFTSENYGDIIFKYYVETVLKETGVIVPFEANQLLVADGLTTLNLSAETGIKALNRKEFIDDSGNRLEGRITIAQAVAYCFKQLYDPNTADIITSENIEVYVDDIEVSDTIGFFGNYIDAEAFKETSIKWLNCYQVLEVILGGVFELQYYDGNWRIKTFNSYTEDAVLVSVYDSDGALSSSSSTGITAETYGDLKILAKGSEGRLFSKRKVKVIQQIKSLISRIVNPTFERTSFDIDDWTNEESLTSTTVGGDGSNSNPNYWQVNGSVYSPLLSGTDTEYLESTSFNWYPYGQTDFADRQLTEYYSEDERLKLSVRADYGTGVKGGRMMIIATYSGLSVISRQADAVEPYTETFQSITLYYTNDGWSTVAGFYETGTSAVENIEIPQPDINQVTSYTYRALNLGTYNLETPPTFSVTIRLFRPERKKIGEDTSEVSGYTYFTKYYSVQSSIWTSSNEDAINGGEKVYLTDAEADRDGSEEIKYSIYNDVSPYAYGSIYASDVATDQINGFKRVGGSTVTEWGLFAAKSFLRSNDKRLHSLYVNVKYDQISYGSLISLNSTIYRIIKQSYNASSCVNTLSLLEVNYSSSAISLQISDSEFVEVIQSADTNVNALREEIKILKGSFPLEDLKTWSESRVLNNIFSFNPDGGFMNLLSEGQEDTAGINLTDIDGTVNTRIYKNDDGLIVFSLQEEAFEFVVGEDEWDYCKAGEAIAKGDVVYVSGAVGASSKMEVSKFIADGSIEERRLYGIAATAAAASGDWIYVMKSGKVRGIDTSGWTAGNILYASPSTAGDLTETIPTAPNLKVAIAFNVDSKANGTLGVRASDLGYHLAEIHDINAPSPSDLDLLYWNDGNSRYELADYATLGIAATDTAWMLGATNALTAKSYIGSASGAHDIGVKVNDTEVLTFKNGGKIGHGTTDPVGHFHIKAVDEAANLLTSATNAALFIEPYSASTWGMAFGSISGQIQYIQGVSAAGGSARDISIQPYGGNTGFGTSAARATVDIVGTTAINLDNAYPSASLPTTLTMGYTSTGISFITEYNQSLNSGKMAVIRHELVGSGNGHLHFETYAGGSGGGTRMSILNNGNVAIGTTSGSKKLTVNGDIQGTELTLTSLTSGYLPKAGTGGLLGNSLIYDNGTAIGIGTDSPSGYVHASADIAGEAILRVQNRNSGTTSDSSIHLNSASTDWYIKNLRNPGYLVFGEDYFGEMMRIQFDGKVLVGTTSGTKLFNVAGTGEFTGEVTFGSNAVLSTAPTIGNHLTNKTYVDTLFAGTGKWGVDVKTISLSNITLSGTQTVSGYALSIGERVLVAGQTTASQNGVYIVASGAWTRATDSDSDAELRSYVYMISAGDYSGYKYRNSNTSAITVDTTDVTYVLFDNNTETDPVFIAWRDGNSVTAGTYKSVTVDTYGRVTAGTNPTTLAGYGITDAFALADGQALQEISGVYVGDGTSPFGLTGSDDQFLIARSSADGGFDFITLNHSYISDWDTAWAAKWANTIANSHIIASAGISETLTLTEGSFERVLKGLYLSGGDTDTRETFFVGTDFNTGSGVFRLQYYNSSDVLSAVEMSFDLADAGRPIVYDPNDATEAIKHVMYQEDFATMLSDAGVSTPTLQQVLDAGSGDTTKQISFNNSPYITRARFDELTANFGGAQGLKSVLSNGTLAENQEINFQQTSATGTGSGSGLVFLDESSVEKGYLNYSNNDDVLSLSASSGYMKIYSSGEIDLRNASAVGFSTSGSNLAVYADKLIITYDLELQHVGPDRGIILKSPDGTRYRVTIDNSGNLTSALA